MRDGTWHGGQTTRPIHTPGTRYGAIDGSLQRIRIVCLKRVLPAVQIRHVDHTHTILLQATVVYGVPPAPHVIIITIVVVVLPLIAKRFRTENTTSLHCAKYVGENPLKYVRNTTIAAAARIERNENGPAGGEAGNLRSKTRSKITAYCVILERKHVQNQKF